MRARAALLGALLGSALMAPVVAAEGDRPIPRRDLPRKDPVAAGAAAYPQLPFRPALKLDGLKLRLDTQLSGASSGGHAADTQEGHGAAAAGHGAGHAKAPVRMSPGALPETYDPTRFAPDPTYEDRPYDVDAQLAIYGGKKAVIGPRPALELGHKMYQAGPLPDTLTGWTGEKNPARPQLLVYGDFRTATAYNNLGNRDTAQLAARLNLDVDLRLTSTERFHAFFRPLDRDGRFSRVEFDGSNRDRPGQKDEELLLNGIARTAFFEGDLGNIVSGYSDRYTAWDFPFAVGLLPLFFQNGIWADDAFYGAAFTLPAKNSARFDISNMDFTFFAGLDKVTTPAVPNQRGGFSDHDAQILGAAAFIERREGYLEMGYAYVSDDDTDNGDFSYHNLTAAWTKRYGGWLSNSVRGLFNLGQDPGPGRSKTANGWLLLVENSLITSKPYTLLPYANFFYGEGRPQSLARDAGAGGPLRNTGINFETDGLTGYPLLDDSARNAYGGALGLQYLFSLNQQLVVELAAVEPRRSDAGRPAGDGQQAVGLRYQRPLDKQWIVRSDAMLGLREDQDELSGVRLELRYKF